MKYQADKTMLKIVFFCLKQKMKVESVCLISVAPQKAAGCCNFIFQLDDGAAADGHAAVVLNLHRVLNVVRPGHRTAVLNLQQQRHQHFNPDHSGRRRHTLFSLRSHHGSAARVSIGISQGSSVHHRKLLGVDMFPQHFLPVTYKQSQRKHLNNCWTNCH